MLLKLRNLITRETAVNGCRNQILEFLAIHGWLAHPSKKPMRPAHF